MSTERNQLLIRLEDEIDVAVGQLKHGELTADRIDRVIGMIDNLERVAQETDDDGNGICGSNETGEMSEGESEKPPTEPTSNKPTPEEN